MQLDAVSVGRSFDLIFGFHSHQARLAGRQHVERRLANRTLNAAAADKAMQHAVRGHNRLGAGLRRGGIRGAHDGRDAKILAALVGEAHRLTPRVASRVRLMFLDHLRAVASSGSINCGKRFEGVRGGEMIDQRHGRDHRPVDRLVVPPTQAED